MVNALWVPPFPDNLRPGDFVRWNGYELERHPLDIAHTVTGTLSDSAGNWYFPDEDAANRIRVQIHVPATWQPKITIVLKTRWFSTATGLADLETNIQYATEVDEMTLTSVLAFTNTNLTWTTANRIKTLTTTITAVEVVADRSYEVAFRRNTGDANTGEVRLFSSHVRFA